MYEFIKGNISYFDKEYIVVENNGIGYKIFTSTNSISELSVVSGEVCIYTDLIVREDAFLLCGFSTKEELETFKILLGVNKIGLKVALSILSTYSYINIKKIIVNNEISLLTKIPGVGKKTAERIVVELKDKFKDIIIVDGDTNLIIDDKNVLEAKEALISLGYTNQEINLVLKNINTKMSVEDIIKTALSNL